MLALLFLEAPLKLFRQWLTTTTCADPLAKYSRHMQGTITKSQAGKYLQSQRLRRFLGEYPHCTTVHRTTVDAAQDL
jgi:hypothetical protein